MHEPRVVLLADTHLGFDHPVSPRVHRRRRGPDFFDNYRRVLDHASSTRPDLVIHGGDVFFRSRVPPEVVDLAYEPLFKLAQLGIPILVVPGNHERSRLPTSLWLAHPNIHVFDRPRTFRFEIAGCAVAVSGFPFVREARDRFRAVLAETGWEEGVADVRVLAMHQAVEGAQVGPSNYTFRSGADVIRMSAIPRDFAAVLAGHIHRSQVLRRPGSGFAPPVIYPGSTERTSFAEKEEPKGFFEISLAPGETGVSNVREARFRALATRPMVDLELAPDAGAAGLEDCLRRQIAGIDENAIVRLKSAGGLNGAARGALTTSFLRSVFPASMDVQLSPAIYRGVEEEPGHVSEVDE